MPENRIEQTAKLTDQDQAIALYQSIQKLAAQQQENDALPILDRIISSLKKTGSLPRPLADMIRGERIKDEPPTGGTEDLLLLAADPKEVEILRHVEHDYTAFLQCLPDTGRTHIIAHLTEHFLVQGRSVLVTGGSPEKLCALKKEITPGLRSLCVCVLEDADMEDCMDKIAEQLSQNTSNAIKKQLDQLAQACRQLVLKNHTDKQAETSDCALPAPEELLSPDAFRKICRRRQEIRSAAAEIAAAQKWKIDMDVHTGAASFETGFGSFRSAASKEDLQMLEHSIHDLQKMETWMKRAAADGLRGGADRQRWLLLIEQVRSLVQYADEAAEGFVKIAPFSSGMTESAAAALLEKLKEHLSRKGRVSRLDRILHGDLEKALSIASVYGGQIQTAADCELVLRTLELGKKRTRCAACWDELFSQPGAFFALDREKPERAAAKNVLPVMRRCLDWGEKEYPLLCQQLDACHIPRETVFQSTASEPAAVDKVFFAAKYILPSVIYVCGAAVELYQLDVAQRPFAAKLNQQWRSAVCQTLLHTMLDGEPAAYEDAFDELSALYAKRTALSEEAETPRPAAPQGGAYDAVVSSYRETCAWYHLLRRLERNVVVRQALVSRSRTAKRAPVYGKGWEWIARNQMIVPVWMMTIEQALAGLDPRINHFDAVIVDGQPSDMTALAVVYMGERLVLVDDSERRLDIEGPSLYGMATAVFQPLTI